LEDELAVLMGGRTAEMLMFNEVTSGADMDIRQATDIAKKMVCRWGMSEKLGALSYTGREEHIFLGRDITRSEDYSDETAREIDREVRRIVDGAESRARDLLRENFDKLKLLGETLLERETLSAMDVYELLGLEPPKSLTASVRDVPEVADETPAEDDAMPEEAVGDPERGGSEATDTAPAADDPDDEQGEQPA
jgi:cell division protease FtsH